MGIDNIKLKKNYCNLSFYKGQNTSLKSKSSNKTQVSFGASPEKVSTELLKVVKGVVKRGFDVCDKNKKPISYTLDNLIEEGMPKIVMKKDGELLGHIIYYKKDGDIIIHSMGGGEQYKHDYKGVGSKLVNEVVRKAHKQGLGVEMDSSRGSMIFYGKNGFIPYYTKMGQNEKNLNFTKLFNAILEREVNKKAVGKAYSTQSGMMLLPKKNMTSNFEEARKMYLDNIDEAVEAVKNGGNLSDDFHYYFNKLGSATTVDYIQNPMYKKHLPDALKKVKELTLTTFDDHIK